ncbi:hypothetical protein [Rhodobacter sp. NSM]|uniref:hypothetical protein n=1 Tax=Rhodobacter sp. NSM TaxID=3457501 RepID=UPI003FD53AC8
MGHDGRKHGFGVAGSPDQKQATGLQIPGMRRVPLVAVCVKNRPRAVKHPQRPDKVARNERDLGFGKGTACAGNRLSRAEGASCSAQKLSGARKITQLSQSDATERQRLRIIAQRDPFQGRQRIARRQRATRGIDQRVHANCAKVVTLMPAPAGDSLTVSQALDTGKGQGDHDAQDENSG